MSRTLMRLLVVCFLSQAIGCAMPWVSKKSKLPKSVADAETPKQMVAVWSDTTYHSPGKPPTRGLAGRIYFYDEEQKPVTVFGKLLVYGYDDTNGQNANRAPDRKFEFTADEFPHHYEEGTFGPSYSVWLPWDKVGGQRADVSVVPVFTTADGQVCVGSHARAVLPGTGNPNSIAGRLQTSTTATVVSQAFQRPTESQMQQQQSLPRPEQQMVQRAGFAGPEVLQQAGASEPVVESQLRSTSIPLPPSVTRRLANSTPQQSSFAASQPIRKRSRSYTVNATAARQPAAPQPLTGAAGVNSQVAPENQSQGARSNRSAATLPNSPRNYPSPSYQGWSQPGSGAGSQPARFGRLRRRAQAALAEQQANAVLPMQPYPAGSPSVPASQSQLPVVSYGAVK